MGASLPAGRHAVLTFALPEDEDALRDALDGVWWKLMVWRLDASLRDLAKYNENNDAARGRATWARAKLREAIEDAGLSEEFER